MSIFSPNLLVTLRFIKRKLRSMSVQYSFFQDVKISYSQRYSLCIHHEKFILNASRKPVVCETLGVVFMVKCILQSCVNISRLLNSIRAGLFLTHIPI